MVLNQLKQIRDELEKSATSYDNAFKNTALIAATELASQAKTIEQNQTSLGSSQQNKISLKPVLDKKYFIAKYGNLKKAKTAYQETYGRQKYGRSWAEFIAIAQKLASESPQAKTLTLEERITKIENFLVKLGYQI
ncbi:MAG: hypothetical protein AAFQ80_18185 [Cyanobacteria bacterium J06621_8]